MFIVFLANSWQHVLFIALVYELLVGCHWMMQYAHGFEYLCAGNDFQCQNDGHAQGWEEN